MWRWDAGELDGTVSVRPELLSKSKNCPFLSRISYRHPAHCQTRAQARISLSDHCPIRLSQGSETVFRRRLCRSMSLSYGFNHHSHGRGREFEPHRPRHFLPSTCEEPAKSEKWFNLVHFTPMPFPPKPALPPYFG